MAVRLSVNVNKIATLRNSRGGHVPNLGHAVDVILAAGARGITVHPRQDERHITRRDVVELAEQLRPLRDTVEYNVEGDPRPDLMNLVCELQPHQCTLVPVRVGERTSEAGWDPGASHDELEGCIARLKARSIRVSLFVEARADAVRWAEGLGADRVELYTEPYARAFKQGRGAESYRVFAEAAELAHELGLGVNAGHDLDLENLPLFKALPHLEEVSIGHALVSDALFRGLSVVVREYLECLA